MFDVGFSEILVIAVVALIVIGPERLPKVARTMGHLFGRMQRYVNDVKSDISREMELDELRKLQTDMQDAARSLETTVKQEVTETEKALTDVAALPAAAAQPGAEIPPAPAPAETAPQASGLSAESPSRPPAA
jgi:sec-independent protein translocase protein TatB